MGKTEVKNCELCALHCILCDFLHIASQSMKWGWFKYCQKEESNFLLINLYKEVLDKYSLLVRCLSHLTLSYMDFFCIQKTATSVSLWSLQEMQNFWSCLRPMKSESAFWAKFPGDSHVHESIRSTGLTFKIICTLVLNNFSYLPNCTNLHHFVQCFFCSLCLVLLRNFVFLLS